MEHPLFWPTDIFRGKWLLWHVDKTEALSQNVAWFSTSTWYWETTGRSQRYIRHIISFSKKMQQLAGQCPSGEALHLIFDFAEKVPLPSMKEQPSNLHFITGMRFDIFGVHSSNVNCNYILGIPECFWPGCKFANEVLYILSHVLYLHSTQCRYKSLTSRR